MRFTWPRGGYDFLVGDGRLQYGPEYIWESYYRARLFPGFFTSLDLQHVNNPAYNQNRGPVWIYSLRLHMEFGGVGPWPALSPAAPSARPAGVKP